MLLARPPEDYEDLLRESLLRAFNGFDTFVRDLPFKAWVFAIIRNTHIDRQRRRKTSSLEIRCTTRRRPGCSRVPSSRFRSLPRTFSFARRPSNGSGKVSAACRPSCGKSWSCETSRGCLTAPSPRSSTGPSVPSCPDFTEDATCSGPTSSILDATTVTRHGGRHELRHDEVPGFSVRGRGASCGASGRDGGPFCRVRFVPARRRAGARLPRRLRRSTAARSHATAPA